MKAILFLVFLIPQFSYYFFIFGSEDAKRLYDDLMVDYNRLLRPGTNPREALTIKFQLRLSQIIDLHEIDQVMTCSVWMKQVWIDKKLSWNPRNYGGVSVLYVPHEMIWIIPDIVLYNNANNEFNITIATKATLHYSGEVTWQPPAIFKSVCHIDVQWFPFDEQECKLTFGSWTYPESLLRLDFEDTDIYFEEQINRKGQIENITSVDDGIDLSDYYPSVEWDIMSRKGQRRSKKYPSCCTNMGSFVDITYFLLVRRKPLFYTVNLVFPCIGISFLTVIVFYLPSDSGEKISLCVQILVAVTLFFLLVMESIPAISITMPLIGKYLLFTMIMVTGSILVSVICLNLHFRTPTTHRMPKIIKVLFLRILPKLLFMRRPLGIDEESFRRVCIRKSSRMDRISLNYHHDHRVSRDLTRKIAANSNINNNSGETNEYETPQVKKAFENVCFIAELMKKKDRDEKVAEDWKYVAMVLDRLFLIIFSISCISSITFFLQAPTLFDGKQAIDLQYRPSNVSNYVAPHIVTTTPSTI